MCSCSLFLGLPLIFTWWPLASPFSHRCCKIVMFFFQRNWSPLFFISRSNFFSVIHVSVEIKIKWKERIGFAVVVFISKRPGSYAIITPKRACAWNAKFHPGLHEGADVLRTDDFLRTKISSMHRLPNFLIDGAPLRALRALDSCTIKKR